jgi:signal transduction histidine kinase
VRFFLGLRGRLMLALLAVTVLALAGAAIALLVPLDKRLRDDALASLTSDAYTARQAVALIPRSEVYPHSPALARVGRSLRRVGADVAIFAADGTPLTGADSDAAQLPVDRRLAPNRQQRQIVGGGSQEEASVVLHARARGSRGENGRLTPGPLLTLAVTRSLKEVHAARAVFVTGFERAAAVTLLIALVLGFGFSTRLSRRTRALRSTALRVAEEGPGVEPPGDAGRDEIGDLARAFRTMQQRLRVQEEARKTFVSTASHELRTPIAALQLRLGLLHEDLAGEGPDLTDAREQVAHSEAQAGRLAKLASDLLDLSRIDADVPLRREPVQLASLCRVTIAEFDAVPHVAVELVDVDAGVALGDPGKVAQIVRILVDNASRHAPPGRPVRVRVVGATITVEDDGSGVAEGEQELIFDRFRRGNGHGGHPGFGLGLAIGRELALRMGGELALRHGVDPTRFELALEPAGEPPR